MLSWVFQGNIGEIIAPYAGPEQQLIVAIQNNQRDKIQDLLENQRVSPSCSNAQGTTPMHIAVKVGYRDIAEMLLRKGADLCAEDNAGNSTLHYAAKGGHFPTIEWLIEQGCSASVQNSAGQTPYDVSDNHMIRQYLLPRQLKKEASSKDVLQSVRGYPVPQLMVPQQQPGIVTSLSPRNPHLPNAVHSPSSEDQHPMSFPLVDEQKQATPLPVSPPLQVKDIPAVHNPYSQFTPHQVLTGGGEAIKPALQNIPSQLSFPGPPGPVPDSQCSFSSSGNSSTLTPITSQISSTSTAEMLGNWYRKDIKLIKADGFHSSASDKSLQKRYNHTQVQYDLSPPPTAVQLSPHPVGRDIIYGGHLSPQHNTNQPSLRECHSPPKPPHPHGRVVQSTVPTVPQPQQQPLQQ